MTKIFIEKPSTVTLYFYENKNITLSVFWGKELFYFRQIYSLNSCNFNINKTGEFVINVNCKVKIEPIIIREIKYDLPAYQKNFGSNFKIVFNKNLINTPARCYYTKGIIEVSPYFLTLPYPIRQFIIFHEKGHSYYHTEMLADLWAVKEFIKAGFNNSSAYYALKNVLKSSTVNNMRIQNLFSHLNKKT